MASADFDPQALLAEVSNLLGEAVQVLEHAWGPTAQVRHKGPADLVTDADLAVQRFLIPRLIGLLPGRVVVAEEEGQSTPAQGPLRWLVDPVDGTSNLVHGVRYVAISVALADDAGPILAGVQDVFGQRRYTAWRQHGAFVDGTQIHGSTVTSLANALVACGTPYDKDRPSDVFSPLARVWQACHDLRIPGAAALELAQVAEGRLDAFFEGDLEPWDFAAGRLLVTEAGGTVTDWAGGPRTLERGGIVAAGRLVHGELLAILTRTVG